MVHLSGFPGKRQLEALTERLSDIGYKYSAYTKVQDFPSDQGTEEGLGILAKWPILSPEAKLISSQDYPPRFCLTAKVLGVFAVLAFQPALPGGHSTQTSASICDTCLVC